MKLLIPIAGLLIALNINSRAQVPADAFAKECAGRVRDGQASVRGDDPAWFFLNRELKQLGAGKFWEKDWAEIAANKSDPTPHMVKFNDLLKEKGVRLILVPVPVKAAIYPDKLAARFSPGNPLPLKGYFDELRKQGVDVLDVEPDLNSHRAKTGGEGADKLYCEQDSHFAPLTAEIIAAEIKKKVAGEAWFDAQPKQAFKRSGKQALTITGDQVKGAQLNPAPQGEVLTLTYAGKEVGGKIEPVAADQDSPVLLLGDSHTMVFTDGASTGMHCQGAGLQDQIQYELGFAIDRVANRGSGLVQARKSLVMMRVRSEPEFWDKKKLVVWVFSAREFTQSSDRLIDLPIEIPNK
jgi:alginate O-acetyltransferase complex protein AlgJ